jgi:transcriptional regulator with XRE-family HTH domain
MDYVAGYGVRLRELREFVGLTQIGAAKRIKADQAQFSRWEGGKKVPSLKSLVALAGLTSEPQAWISYVREGGVRPDRRNTIEAARDGIISIGSQLRAAALQGRGMSPEEVNGLAVFYRLVVEPVVDDKPATARKPAEPTPADGPVTIGDLATDLDRVADEMEGKKKPSAKPSRQGRKGKRTG